MKKIVMLAVGLIAGAQLSIVSQHVAAAGEQERGYTPRQQMVYDIVNTWGPHVREAYRADIGAWARRMGPVFKRASLDALRRAADARTFEQMNAALLDDGASGGSLKAADLANAAPKVLGDIDRDLVFVPVTPCRIIDTRIVGGAIAANTVRSFDITSIANYSSQGGDSSNCNGVGAAGSFAAAAINFTVVTPGAAGYITAFPFGATQPLAATVNYTAGDIRGNYAVVKLDQGAAADELSVYSFAQTHLVADIVGYYRSAGTVGFECVSTSQASAVIPGGGTDNVNAPNCLVGYTQTATNCETTSWLMPIVFINGGTCSARNNSSNDATLRASRTCCRARFN